ncbi:MAG: PDDEXK nuclease domain-containing protein, partial [Treponema sp.]|nr:PDDEXK nuclease domain-containing protein [Treponema sp.]
YGQNLIKKLSEYLTEKFKKGFSEVNLKNARLFYNTYSKYLQKRQTVSAELQNGQKNQALSDFLPQTSKNPIQQALSAELDGYKTMQQAAQFFKLGWSHYTLLMRIENEDERHFYEIEAEREGWSFRHLKRQYHSSLYERLALSKDKNEVKRLSREGQVVEKPQDILKNPLVLEFLGMAEDATYSETELETAIISKLQAFLLELGKGFLFEARQKRFTFDEQSFFVDLVFYNRLLQCYVLIDLKNDELKHQDLGQMLMYVNYFDRYVKQDFEKPSIGILLCKKKSDNIVELTLPENAQIYASDYSLYLPDKSVLQQKLIEWIKEFEDEHGEN